MLLIFSKALYHRLSCSAWLLCTRNLAPKPIFYLWGGGEAPMFELIGHHFWKILSQCHLNNIYINKEPRLSICLGLGNHQNNPMLMGFHFCKVFLRHWQSCVRPQVREKYILSKKLIKKNVSWVVLNYIYLELKDWHLLYRPSRTWSIRKMWVLEQIGERSCQAYHRWKDTANFVLNVVIDYVSFLTGSTYSYASAETGLKRRMRAFCRNMWSCPYSHECH